MSYAIYKTTWMLLSKYFWSLSWENTATYGAIGPLWFGRGEEHIAQRAEGAEQHGSDHTGNFYPGSDRREA